MTESDMFGIPMEEYERIYKDLYGASRTIGKHEGYRIEYLYSNGEYIPTIIYDLKE